MTGSRTPSRNSYIRPAKAGPTTNDAALLGASAAFARPSLSRSSTANTVISANTGTRTGIGAYAAASSAGHGTRPRSPDRNDVRGITSRAASSMSIHERTATSGSTASTLSRISTGLAPRDDERDKNSKSPSQQAAAAAAMHAPGLSQPPSLERISTQTLPARNARPTVASKPASLSYERTREGIKKDQNGATDTTSIPSTTSLVDLFEARLKPSADGIRSQPIVIKPTSTLPLQSPKPVKPGEGITSMFQLELGGLDGTHDRSASVPVQIPASTTNVPRIVSPSGVDHAQPNSPMRNVTNVDGTASPSSPTTQNRSTAYSRSSSTHTTPSRPTSRLDVPGTINQPRTMPAQYNARNPRRTTPLTNDDELANAMVASSLASSRAKSRSPGKLEPPQPIPPPIPARRRKHTHHAHLSRHGVTFSRTPSPIKTGMLHTLRPTHDSDSDASTSSDRRPGDKNVYSSTGTSTGRRRGHAKRLVRKHPNKHHEGDRKRWRDAVSERARKRYEGVWAANKGLYCSFTLAEQADLSRRGGRVPGSGDGEGDDGNRMGNVGDQVSNLVAREIWMRSRLPGVVLEAVWDLVDTDGVGRLRKEEFVVGMWLIDQRLKGRKLPTVVSETVWASVRGLQGIKVKVRKR